MMIQIGHRESQDIDLFVDDPQLFGFPDPSRSPLHFTTVPATYDGDGARFQKFAFAQLGEIDFIIAGGITPMPFRSEVVEGRMVNLETVAEISAKKIRYRGADAKPPDIFDIAADPVAPAEGGSRLAGIPEQVAGARRRLGSLNPEFVERTISQLMIRPSYRDMAGDSLEIAASLVDEVLQQPSSGT